MTAFLVLFLAILAYYFIIFVQSVEKSVITLLIATSIMALKLVEKMNLENVGIMVDFNTLGLLLGMMIIVGFLKRSGFFQYSIIKILRFSGGDFKKTLFFLMVIVALTSAFLDNVITIMMVLPMIFLIADSMEMDPTPLVFLTIFIDNVGGMSTLIGSPLNLVLGSVSGKSFNEFLTHTGTFSIVAFLIIYFYFSRRIRISKEQEEKLSKLVNVDPEKAITDKKLMKTSLLVFGLVILGFILHSVFEFELSFIAMSGALALMLIFNKNFEKVSEDIDWDTLFFYAGLYMISFSLEEIGAIKAIASVLEPLKESFVLSTLVITWGSAFVIPFLSAVPGTLILAPVLKHLVSMGFSQSVWWAYAFGANLGTNFTPLGAVQNIIGIAMLEKQTNKRISFLEFMKVGIPTTIPAILVGTVWLLVFYK